MQNERKQLTNCVKVEVANLGSPSLISLIVYVDCYVKVEVVVLGSPVPNKP